MAHLGKDKNMIKQPQLDMIHVWDHEVDISVRQSLIPFLERHLNKLRKLQNIIFE